jgi:hypothetical protein
VHRRLSTDGHGRAAPAAGSGLRCTAEPGVHPWCVRPPVRGHPGRIGTGGALMAAAVRERVPVAERARAARVFVAGVSGAGHWGGDDAGRPGELPGTSVRHGRPGRSGGPGPRSPSAPGTAWSGPGHRSQRSPGCGGCAGPAVMAQQAAGSGSRRAWRRGGGPAVGRRPVGRTVIWFELCNDWHRCPAMDLAYLMSRVMRRQRRATIADCLAGPVQAGRRSMSGASKVNPGTTAGLWLLDAKVPRMIG